MRHVLSDGRETSALDPNRATWFSIGCGYWTDDMDRLDRISGPGVLPLCVCPVCGHSTFMIPFHAWEASLAEWDATHPGYAEWVQTYKEFCFGKGQHRSELERRGFVP